MNKEFYLNFKGNRIWCVLSSPATATKHPAILFIHGSGFSQSFELLTDKLKEEFVCIYFAHLGCFKSSGKFEDYTLQSRLEQAKYMLSYLKNLKGVEKDNIAVVGVSMGAHVAARLSESQEFKYLILRAPASYKKSYEGIKMNPGWLPWNRESKDWPWKPSYAFDAIAEFTGNLLIVKCEKDEIVPDKIPDEYYKKASKTSSKKTVVLKNARHYMRDDKVSTLRFAEFIRYHLRDKAAIAATTPKTTRYSRTVSLKSLPSR